MGGLAPAHGLVGERQQRRAGKALGPQVGKRKRCVYLFGGSRCRPPKVEGIPGRGEEEVCFFELKDPGMEERGMCVLIGGSRCRPPRVEGIPGRGEEEVF